MTVLRRSVAGLTAAIALAGCDRSSSPVLAEPEQPRVGITIEPKELRIGERAVLTITVVTPPEHTLSAVVAPSTPSELEILKVEKLPVSVQPRQWIHVTNYHVRARGVGEFTLPAGALEVTAPDGSADRLRAGPLPIRIASILPEYPDRTVPFGARPAPPLPTRDIGAAGAALGSLLLVAALGGLLAAHRWLRRRRQRPTPPAPPIAPPWSAARAEFLRARDALATDATGAADVAAAALRRYVGGRYGAAAAARTTEELEAAMPPFAARSRWPAFVELLHELDSLRFPPREQFDRGVVARRVEDLLHRAESFVDASMPPEPLR